METVDWRPRKLRFKQTEKKPSKARVSGNRCKETTAPTQGTLYRIRAAHLLAILSSDSKEADRLGPIECCLVIGSV